MVLTHALHLVCLCSVLLILQGVRPEEEDDDSFQDSEKHEQNRSLIASGSPAGGKDGGQQGKAKGDGTGDAPTCSKDLHFPDDECPEGCPLAAEKDSQFCTFKCIKADACGTKGTVAEATIPDEKNHMCRRCEVEGCLKCVTARPGQEDEKAERCEKCIFGYSLSENGTECESKGLIFFIAAGVVGAIVIVFAIFWYIGLRCKPVVNEEQVAYAMECRARMMVIQGHHGDEGQPYPFNTNLCTENVAGPGATVLFRYQYAIILWAFVLLAVWLGFVAVVGTDLLFLGVLPAKTPRQLCHAVHWGRHRQMELMWTKVSWLAFAYVFSFVGAIAYGIKNALFFCQHDSENSTLSDYVAVLEGLPKMTGEEGVEEIVKEAVSKALGDEGGKEVLAVSVGWDFSQHVGQVRHFLEEEVGSLESSNSTARAGARLTVMHLAGMSDNEEDAGFSLTGFWGMLTWILLKVWKVDLDDHHEDTVDNLKTTLKAMETTNTAYVVFATEGGREKALAAVSNGCQINVKDASCSLRAETYEPEALFWHNVHMTPGARRFKFVLTAIEMAIACAVWTFLLYLPYAFYMSSFSYAHGDEPGFGSEMIFVCLIVGSQIGLFVASSVCAAQCQFHYEDQKHRMYIIFYNSSLILNLILDIALQSYLSYLQMVGVGARVADGRKLEEITKFQEIFESYPIQKSVGKLLFKYCWPCTFLVPFAVEPFVAQLLPLHIGQLLIAGNKRIKGELAERALELSEMEQGRYADCIFNLVLVCCIPFIAPAYMGLTLSTFLVSHMFIYAYDHWKTLRYARKFYFSSPEVHWLGQKLFCLPVAILAAALVFKGNQMSGGVNSALGGGYLKDMNLLYGIMAAFWGHIIIHLLVLEYVVYPFHQDPNKEENTTTFSEVAAEDAATHLTTNPIQCLRSKYILPDDPPLSMFVLGKEHLMRPNPKIGAFYDGAAKEEHKKQKAGGAHISEKDETKTPQLPQTAKKEEEEAKVEGNSAE